MAYYLLYTLLFLTYIPKISSGIASQATEMVPMVYYTSDHLWISQDMSPLKCPTLLPRIRHSEIMQISSAFSFPRRLPNQKKAIDMSVSGQSKALKRLKEHKQPLAILSSISESPNPPINNNTLWPSSNNQIKSNIHSTKKSKKNQPKRQQLVNNNQLNTLYST